MLSEADRRYYLGYMTPDPKPSGPRISLFFRWYDLWIGAYYDRESSALYLCPIPMFGIKILLKG
jgi:hypothetical protein